MVQAERVQAYPYTQEQHHLNTHLMENPETYRGYKQIPNSLHLIPFCHTGGQGNLEHGMALQDLFHPVEYGLDLSSTQNSWLCLQ